MSDSNTGKSTGGAEKRPVEEEVHTEVVHVGRPWLGLTIACAVVAIILVVLAIPGVLLAPTPSMDDAAMVEAQRESNDALRERLEQLRGLSEEAVCRADGALYGRDEGGMSLVPLEGGRGALMPPLERSPDPAAPGESGSSETGLVDLMDRATAFVIAPSVTGEGFGTGTGFFVAPSKLLTNRHVVEAADGRVFVFVKGAGTALQGRVVATTSSTDVGGPDFALVDIAGASGASILSIAPPATRLQSVVAAGYPGLVTTTDERFRQLIEGDMSSVPQVSFTDGVVTALQEVSGAELVLHSAAISPGNSGGPLIDLCGNVVGVNTFVRAEETFRRMNYALSARTASNFLQSNGVTPQRADSACSPSAAASPRGEAAAPSASGTAE